MAIIFGGLVAAAALFIWLSGGWFGRVLVFLLLASILAVLAAVDNSGHAPVWIVVGWPGAWVVSSLPIYYWRRKDRHVSMEMTFH
jgi:hypothetical protein